LGAIRWQSIANTRVAFVVHHLYSDQDLFSASNSVKRNLSLPLLWRPGPEAELLII
jgi:hypothetical protein